MVSVEYLFCRGFKAQPNLGDLEEAYQLIKSVVLSDSALQKSPVSTAWLRDLEAEIRPSLCCWIFALFRYISYANCKPVWLVVGWILKEYSLFSCLFAPSSTLDFRLSG